jgi:hypothetical protein
MTRRYWNKNWLHILERLVNVNNIIQTILSKMDDIIDKFSLEINYQLLENFFFKSDFMVELYVNSWLYLIDSPSQKPLTLILRVRTRIYDFLTWNFVQNTNRIFLFFYFLLVFLFFVIKKKKR